MEFLEQTMQTCRDFLQRDPKIGRCYEKAGDSRNKGFLYEYRQDDRVTFMDLQIEEELKLLILFAHADILAAPQAGQLLANYCQTHTSPWDPALLVYSPERRNVYSRIMTPVLEAPLTGDTLDWMNRCAYGKLSACLDDLTALADGRISPTWLPPETAQPEHPMPCAFPDDNLRETKARLAEELRDAHYNILGRNLSDEDDVLYYCQLVTEDELFYERISVHESGCLLLGLRSAYRVSRELLGRAAQYCNRVNSLKLLAGLHACCRDGYLWCSCPVSLRDGPVGLESTSLIEKFGLHMLSNAIQTLQSWILPEWADAVPAVEDGEEEPEREEDDLPRPTPSPAPWSLMDVMRHAAEAQRGADNPGRPGCPEQVPFPGFFHEEDPDFPIPPEEEGPLPGFESFFDDVDDGPLPGLDQTPPKGRPEIEDDEGEAFA